MRTLTFLSPNVFLYYERGIVFLRFQPRKPGNKTSKEAEKRCQQK
jgi:hypothetical protein